MPTELNCSTGNDQHDVPFVFAGEGEMARLVNEHRWEDTPLGPVSSWPESIRSAVSIALGSTFQLVVLSGPELVYIYNDASSSIFGQKHPWALGKPTSMVWAEAWETLGPMLLSVYQSGRALRHDDLLLVLQRHGYVEECYFTFSYSPVRSAHGITGVFVSVLETSERVVNERRLRTLGKLAARVASERGEQVYAGLAEVLNDSLDELPCTGLYLWDAALGRARTVFHTGAEGGCIEPAGQVARAMATGAVQEFDAGAMLADGVSYGVWPEPPRHGLAFPLMLPGACKPSGVFVVLANPRQALDAPHRSFLDFVAGHVATALANAEAARIEQERLAAMAELNHARNAFFAHASHELRTPLTLILGPLESLLDGPAGDVGTAAREPLEMVRRNALRMKRLVNSLLDFASIEAGRLQIRLAPTDLGAITMGLAGLFQSAFASAGVGFSATVPAQPVEVLADLDMWEKIVLNLLSNALKFTPAGKVELVLREDGGMVELSVRDTGVGIGAADLPHIFERFYRGAHHSEHAGAECSGLGLALASELVRLLDGTLTASSVEGKGTTIVARIPARAAAGAPATPAALLPHAQADAIMADAQRALKARTAPAGPPLGAADAALAGGLMKVVAIDDNADVGRYLEQVLHASCTVSCAGDAVSGLEAIRRVMPDLVLLDVMMPGTGGFELLRTIRGDEAIQSLPVIILSAHAGEDARLEALAAGADDYLVKPFSARELVAMVRSHVRLVRIRRAAIEREARLLNQIAEVRSDLESVMAGTSDAFMSVDCDLRIVALKKARWSVMREPAEALIGRVLPEAEPEMAPVAEALRRAMRGHRTVGLQYLHRPSGRWFSVRCYPGGQGAIAFANEITRQKMAEERLKLAHADLEQRVLERTRDLKKAADEVLASRNELRFLYDWLQHVRKDERIALAREVHDQLGQILSAAKIDIKLLLEDVQASSTGLPRRKLVAELRSACTTLDQAIESARSIATELRPPEIENQGLYSAIEWHARDFERRTRVRVELSLPARTRGPSGPAAVALFRIFQEALTNILRHARATSVSVALQWRGARVLLRVRDNGVGIAAGRTRAAGTLGLVGMRERAELAHGRVAVRRLASGGTLVTALLPVPYQDER